MEAKDVVDFNHVMEHIRNTLPNETHEVVDQKKITVSFSFFFHFSLIKFAIFVIGGGTENSRELLTQ